MFYGGMWNCYRDETSEITEEDVPVPEYKEPSVPVPENNISSNLTKLCNFFSFSTNNEESQRKEKEWEEELYAEKNAADQAKKQEIEAQQKMEKLAKEAQQHKKCKINGNSSAYQHVDRQGVTSVGYRNQDTADSNNFPFLQKNVYNSRDPRVIITSLQQQMNEIENEVHQKQIKKANQVKPIKELSYQNHNNTSFGKYLPPTTHRQDTRRTQIVPNNNTQFRSNKFGHVTKCNYQFEELNNIVIPHPNETRSIGVIGLAMSGKSFLIRALAGGLPLKELTNPIVITNVAIFELNHPNNGFISGSVEQNAPIYDAFFQKAHLSNLSCLIICSYGSVREEDYLLICLAQKYQIPCLIVRTKLDEWLENSETDQSKEQYVFKDKQYVAGTLQNLNLNFQSENIYNVSAIAVIKSAKGNGNPSMKKYAQDEQALMNVLKLSENH